MSTYRFCSDHVVGAFFYPAGTTAQTADVGGSLPVGWPPSAQCDPLDAAAVQAFWNVGPQLLGPVIGRWVGQSVAPPITRWTDYRWPNVFREFVLTGLGSAMPMKNLTDTRGVVP